MNVVIHAATDTDGSAAAFASARQPELLSQLWSHGALLFRGFSPAQPETFETTVALFAPELMAENGEHEPIAGRTRVYRPVDYDPSRSLLWHNENSFDRTWPQVIAFCCVKPASHGGETTLVASQSLMQRLDPEVVEQFRRKGVRYVRRMGLGVGRTWQQVFRTQERSVAAAACRAGGFEYEWLDDDVLQTACTRPATVRHPITGAACWFNQAQHWHTSCLDAATRNGLLEAFGVDRMPRDCTFGDGSVIEDSVMAHILEGYRAAEWPLRWQTGDMLILDNISVAHGRLPYQGRRELLVAMGTPRHFSGLMTAGEELCS